MGINDPNDLGQLHDWLDEDGSDGAFEILYRSSRDGFSSAAFHAKCDGRGATLTIIETAGGRVVGGYSNAPWKSPEIPQYESANRAFLFALSGKTAPIKLNLKDRDDGHAVFHDSSQGPIFGGGHDLAVYWDIKRVRSNNSIGSYKDSPLESGVVYFVREVEVFL